MARASGAFISPWVLIDSSIRTRRSRAGRAHPSGAFIRPWALIDSSIRTRGRRIRAGRAHASGADRFLAACPQGGGSGLAWLAPSALTSS